MASPALPPPPPPPRPARRWRRRLLIAFAVLVALAGAGWIFLSLRTAFPGVAVSASPAGAVSPLWWEAPSPLTPAETAARRWLDSITHAPDPGVPDPWSIGGRQYGVSSIRYQAAFTGYAACALGMRTPAYPEATGRVLRNLIDRMLDRKTWDYVGAYWKDAPTYPDPCAHENIMYTGHLLQLLCLYEAMTGDTRYRTGGFDLRWDEATVFRYDTMKLVDVTVRQMRANACGGVACEPGLVFFPCNNHPQIALKLLEGMGLGDWAPERERWERWALSSYHAVAGGGAFKLLYHQDSGAFAPRGHPGLDGWSLLWYEPWASDPANAARIWEIARARLTLPGDGAVTTGPAPACCDVTAGIPEAAVASFLAPAARVCGDSATAQRLEAWLDAHFRTDDGGRLWWEAGAEWRIGVSANRILALALAHGTDLRALVQRPLPRNYFDGALLERVEPKEVAVRQAFRDGTTLVLELDGAAGEWALFLRNAPALPAVEGLAPEKWSYADNVLRLSAPGGVLRLRIGADVSADP